VSGNRLAGKVGIVTGTGSEKEGAIGSGKATALLFAQQGAKVVVVDQIPEHAEETRAQIEAEGGEAAAVVGDLSQAETCAAAVETALKRFGRLDALVNNVAVVLGGNVMTVDEERWQRTLDVNLKSALLLSQLSIPHMRDSGGGSIVNVSSTGWTRSAGEQIAYAASKAGLVALARGIAVSHGAWGIRANTINPGQMHTSFVAGIVSDEMRENRRYSNPLGREGTGWDIGWAAVFLSSDEAAWVTGVDFPVDGGFSIAPVGFDFRRHRPAGQ
jgi:NAD(P)-dependent dehydrogenase (short-subunit alcohol dehydrogenase family)